MVTDKSALQDAIQNILPSWGEEGVSVTDLTINLQDTPEFENVALSEVVGAAVQLVDCQKAEHNKVFKFTRSKNLLGAQMPVDSRLSA